MKIEDCTVDVNSKKELYGVETVCFAQDIVWCGSGRQHINICGDKKVLISDDDLSTTSCEHLELPRYTADEFIEKFGENSKTKHRIKTKEEFIEEFGEEWDDKIKCGWSHDMNRFFGRKLTADEEETYLKERGFSDLTIFQIDSWGISNDMITEVKAKPKVAKAKHRIKTKKEFIDEFGDNWINGKVSWNSVGEMDYLFGHELTEDEEEEYLSTTDSFYIDDKWFIHKNMVTEIKKDKPKWNIIDRLISTPKVTLNDSLYKKRKVKLNQNN